MNIVFRTDASETLGFGHLMRCTALAQWLRREGARVAFVSHALPDWVHDRFHRYDIEFLEIPEERSSWADGGASFDPEFDASTTNRLLGTLAGRWQGVDWLVIDHYRIDHKWQAQLQLDDCRILVIDDLADRSHRCDVLVDANIAYQGEHPYKDLVPRQCRCLFGPRYALLSPDFYEFEADRIARSDTALNVLVCFGGGDHSGEVLKVLEGLAACSIEGVSVILIAAENTRIAEFIEQHAGRLPPVTWLHHVDDMPVRLANADIAVGGGGVMNWERAFFEVPSIVVSLADNQRRSNEWLSNNGKIIYLGVADAATPKAYAAAITTLIGSPGLRNYFANSNGELVDGKGAGRVVKEMLRPAIRLREAGAADIHDVFEWHNAPSTWQFSIHQRPATWGEHQQWYQRVLEDPDRVLLIGEADGSPVGVLRFDIVGNKAVVSVYLVPGHYGRGFGKRLLEEGMQWLRAHRSEVTLIEAVVAAENIASCRVFSELGYQARFRTYELSLRHEPS